MVIAECWDPNVYMMIIFMVRQLLKVFDLFGRCESLVIERLFGVCGYNSLKVASRWRKIYVVCNADYQGQMFLLDLKHMSYDKRDIIT